ncbi:small heat shock protein [unidentified eubacterium SCB49]|nr:small heat shock protein [unidentified eubacterium SCB49]
MKTLQNTNAWLPSIFEDLLKEGRIDTPSHNAVLNHVNIIENEKDFVLHILAPGFTKKSFEIALDKNALSVTGTVEKTDVKEEKPTLNFTRKEFMVKDFKRTFTLPETIDVDAISANYENGILAITLPKKEIVAIKKKMVEIS